MGTFQVDIEIGDPQGERWERVRALVDTGSTYTALPASLLRRLGVEADDRARFRLTDGRTADQNIGQTWLRVDGKRVITRVVFANEEALPLLGAYALEGLLLAPDPVGKRLVPVERALHV